MREHRPSLSVFAPGHANRQKISSRRFDPCCRTARSRWLEHSAPLQIAALQRLLRGTRGPKAALACVNTPLRFPPGPRGLVEKVELVRFRRVGHSASASKACVGACVRTRAVRQYIINDAAHLFRGGAGGGGGSRTTAEKKLSKKRCRKVVGKQSGASRVHSPLLLSRRGRRKRKRRSLNCQSPTRPIPRTSRYPSRSRCGLAAAGERLGAQDEAQPSLSDHG